MRRRENAHLRVEEDDLHGEDEEEDEEEHGAVLEEARSEAVGDEGGACGQGRQHHGEGEGDVLQVLVQCVPPHLGGRRGGMRGEEKKRRWMRRGSEEDQRNQRLRGPG